MGARRLFPAACGTLAKDLQDCLTLEQDRMKWRGVEMDEELRGRIIQAAKEVISEKLDLSVLDRYLEAA
jgi:hypothetical protein